MSPWWRRRPAKARFGIDEVRAVIATSVGLEATLEGGARARLVELTIALAETKTWEPVRGFTLTDEMQIVVAANAAIPVLNLDLSVYSNVRSIILRESTAQSHGLRSGPAAGTVSDEPMLTIGMASGNEGPIALSWDAVLAQSRRPQDGRNVVIHEFAHKIDMSDGYTDGAPPLRGQPLADWMTVLVDEYEHIKTRPSDAALRPYAWTNRAEFFAVASEAFFCTPADLAAAKPALYGGLSSFYRQDPATVERPTN